MKRGLKAKNTYNSVVAVLLVLNEKRIESKGSAFTFKLLDQLAQWKEDWKVLNASLSSSFFFSISMKRGLKGLGYWTGVNACLEDPSMKRGLKDKRCASWWVGGVMSLNEKRIESPYQANTLTQMNRNSMKRGLKDYCWYISILWFLVSQWKEDWKYSPDHNIYSLPTIYLNEKRIERGNSDMARN